MAELTPEEQRIVDAWTIKGPVPNHHTQQQRILQHNWPTLSNAIEALVRKAQQ